MRGRKRIFENLQRLNEMLALRRQGVGPSYLGNLYHVDHSTIIYHCRRNGVLMPRQKSTMIVSSGMLALAAQEKIVLERRRIVVHKDAPMVLIDFDGSPVNRGRTYAEYLEQRNKRDAQIKKERINNFKYD